MIDNALVTVVHASRCAVNHTVQTSLGAMVFNRDMMVNVPLIANLLAIGNRRQHLVDENLRRINAKQINHSYNIGNWVKFVEYSPDKLDCRNHGSYPIIRVFTNGTVHLQLAPHIQETLNTRKLFPYNKQINKHYQDQDKFRSWKGTV